MKTLLMLLSLAATGCQSGVTLPRLPAWQEPTDTREISPMEIVDQARTLAPLATVTYTDNAYTLVSYAWLQRYLDWTWAAAKADGLEYTPESFDCEDFADAFVLFVRRAAARAGIKASPLAATVKVAQLQTFANVPGVPGTRHEVVGVATDLGTYIIEPQPAAGAFRTTLIGTYPNLILEINLGRK